MGVRLSEHPERMIIMSMRGGYQIIDLKNVPLYSGFLKDNVEYHRHNGVITIDKFLELANK